MTSVIDIENAAGLSRATCGWRLPGLDLADVWSYWRDVHSPAISRRAGIHLYRHFRWDPVDVSLFEPVDGVAFAAAADAQLQWMSDIIYRDERDLAEFYRSPGRPEVTARILDDIDMIVDRSTTYLSVGDAMHTVTDATDDPTPQGPPSRPHYGVYLRQRGSDDERFRAAVRTLVAWWAEQTGVLRVRFNLFERPDMEADRHAGYPVKTHPVEQQYQGLVELVLTDRAAAAALFAGDHGVDLAAVVETVHAYPVNAVYTFVHGGRPTLVGLRGYPAYTAIRALGATHATDEGLLEWMYGPVVHGAELIVPEGAAR